MSDTHYKRSSSSPKQPRASIDKRLTWKANVTKKRKEMVVKIERILLSHWKKVVTFILENRILLYKTTIRSIWLYERELRGCTSNLTINANQLLPSEVLRTMADDLRIDPKILYVKDVIKQKTKEYHNILVNHPIKSSEPLKNETCYTRLKKKWQKRFAVL